MFSFESFQESSPLREELKFLVTMELDNDIQFKQYFSICVFPVRRDF